ncbi:11316_t:CDS:2, partial [Cetraspora pellucida]
KTIETINLTTKQSLDFSFIPNFSISSSLPIINNNKIVEVEVPVTIEVPVVKTPDDGALSIPFNPNNIKSFGDIEEEILACTLPKQWKKIELGRICFQTSSTSKADHYDLKSDGAIIAFVAEIKRKKKLQLCVYQEPKNKNTCSYEESNQSNKKIRLTQIKDVDEKTPPNSPLFDKSKYRYPTSNRLLNNTNIMSQ